IEYGNGARTWSHYDPFTLRLDRLKTTRPRSDDALQDLEYAYDPAGNVTSILDSAQQTIYFRNSAVSASTDYVYDALYRLVRAGGREHAGPEDMSAGGFAETGRVHLPGDGHALRRYQETYQYDAVGNLLEVRHAATNATWARTYEYNEIGAN